MESRPYRTLKVSVDEHVCTITIDRVEKRNALSAEVVNELLWAIDDARDDDDTHVVVLTGAGHFFCAGGDLRQMKEGEGLPLKGDFADLALRFPQLGKPTIARVPGPALGGGLGLVASCDFAVAADVAILGTPEVKRGLFPMMIMAVLARIMPRRRLLSMMLLGESLSAEEALATGILSHVVPEADLDEAVTTLAKRLAAESPTALRLGLRAYHAQADRDLESALPYLREQLEKILKTEDAREGLAAFAEKREPKWTGR